MSTRSARCLTTVIANVASARGVSRHRATWAVRTAMGLPATASDPDPNDKLRPAVAERLHAAALAVLDQDRHRGWL